MTAQGSERAEDKPLDAVTKIITAIRGSQSLTYQGLEDDIKQVVEQYHDAEGSLESLSVVSACDIFRQFITRLSRQQLEIEIGDLKSMLVERGEQFLEVAKKARDVIAEQLLPFLRENTSILVHGYSDAVVAAVLHAASKRRLRLIVTEGRPGNEGYRFLQKLSESGCSAAVHLIPDTAVAATLSEVDIVLLGAGVVTENGGIISTVGSYQIALVAKQLNRPVYVCTESLKLAKIYPLDQTELPPARGTKFVPLEELSAKQLSNTTVDYTPPQYITQIYTDLGIMTSAAMSDELLKLYT
ncbi:Translation initiation factor eIF-2B subunit alpha [Diplonema papillatum]|nr:Translation initiation factor eIF-2B subunit alpha [Diplonema papillatum]